MGLKQQTPPKLGKAAAEHLITKLVQDGSVSVIERSASDKLLAEPNFSNNDRTAPITAAKLGRGGGGVPFGGFGGNPMKTKHDIKAKVQMSIRLASPDTAEVLAVSQGKSQVNRKGVKGACAT